MRNVLCGLMVLGLVAMVANAQPIKDYKWDGNIPILDNSVSAPAIIDVPPDAGGLNQIGDLDVDLIIQHTWQGDLQIDLSHAGQTRRLMDRPGFPEDSAAGWSSDNLGNPATGEKFVFDDEANAPYDTPTFPNPGISNPVGAWQPDTDALSLWDGKDKRGIWEFIVTDNAGGDTGAVLNFSLHFQNVPEPSALCLLGLGALALFRRR